MHLGVNVKAYDVQCHGRAREMMHSGGEDVLMPSFSSRALSLFDLYLANVCDSQGSRQNPMIG